MAIKIITPGITSHRFNCRRCGCVFEVDDDAIKAGGTDHIVIVRLRPEFGSSPKYHHDCPTCGDMAFSDTKQGEYVWKY